MLTRSMWRINHNIMRCALLPSRFSAKLVLLKKCWTMIFLYGPLFNLCPVCSIYLSSVLVISLGEMVAGLLYHTSVYFVLKYCLSLPKSIPSLSFPLTNDHMCPPLPLFHGVIANTLANGRKKWGLHANFGGIVSPGYIHTKHNAVIIRVQTPASSSASLRSLC